MNSVINRKRAVLSVLFLFLVYDFFSSSWSGAPAKRVANAELKSSLAVIEAEFSREWVPDVASAFGQESFRAGADAAAAAAAAEAARLAALRAQSQIQDKTKNRGWHFSLNGEHVILYGIAKVDASDPIAILGLETSKGQWIEAKLSQLIPYRLESTDEAVEVTEVAQTAVTLGISSKSGDSAEPFELKLFDNQVGEPLENNDE